MKTILFKSFFITILLFASSGFSQEKKVEDVKIFVENIGNSIIRIASDSKLSESQKKQKIILEVDSVVDASWISKFVLGKYYRDLSEQQKNKFSELYRQFMINTYGPKFKNYNGKKFEVTRVEKQAIFYTAHTQFFPRDSGNQILIDFRVKEQNGKLFVIDFIAEGISLLESQRSEFNSAINQSGIDQFISNLEKRVESLKK